MSRRQKSPILAVVLGAIGWFPAAASACSICYGEPDSPVSRGLTWAIVALGTVVVGVLAGAVAFFVQANRKATVLAATESATAIIEKH